MKTQTEDKIKFPVRVLKNIKRKKEKIYNDIIARALNNIEVLYDFENTTDKEFFKTYGFRKSHILNLVKEKQNENRK